MTDAIEVLVNNLDKSFSISASAGCGKTYALVARVIALLEKGISIKRMLLLTFSDNAALEMKERIIDELKKHIGSKWADEALEDIHYSSISTFHSFSLDICRSYPEKIGINHQMSLLDELSKDRLQRQFFNQSFNAWGSDENLRTFITNSYLNGIKRNTWFGFFTNIYENLDFEVSIETIDIDSSGYDSNISKQIDRLKEIAQLVVNEYAIINIETLTPSRQERLSQFKNLSKVLCESQTNAQFFSIIKNSDRYIGSKGFSISRKPLEIDNTIESLGEEIEQSTSDIANTTLRLGTSLLLNAAKAFRAENIARGYLTFSDAILGAKKILQNETDNFEVWQKYDCIIVDEFQDTDPHQLEIIKALSSNASEGDIGRLFVVGDHKQSIYGFRGVEVEKYREFVASQELSTVSLDISRRTTKNIVENVNQIMHNLINDYDEMKHVRDDFSNNSHPHFSILGGALEQSTPEIRKSQGTDIAMKIPELLGLEILDKHTNEFRKSKYDDITILLRDRSGLSELLEALQNNNIPFSVDSPALIFDNRFTQMALTCLKAIAEPKNSIAMIGALRSSLFRCSNNELLDYVNYIDSNKESKTYIDNHWDTSEYTYIDLSIAPENVIKVFNAIKDVESLNIESQKKELVTFLFEVFFQRSFAIGAVNAKTENSKEISDIVKILISKAISYASNSSTKTLIDFISQLEYERKSSRSNDKISLETDSNVVHILTAHSSKGLEFPIVIYVPSLKKENSNKTAKMYLIQDDSSNNFAESIALFGSKKFKDSRLNSYLDARSAIEIDEESRISYVGLTRARDYLVVCKHHKVSGKDLKPTKSGAYSLANAIEKAQLDTPVFASSDVVNLIGTEEELAKENILQSREKIVREKKQKIEDLIIKIEEERVLSPGGTEDGKIPDVRISKSPKDTSLGPAIGRAVHRSLNLVDFKGSDKHISTICTNCAYEEGIVSSASEVEKYVRNALSTNVISNISTNHYREVPIVGELNGKTYSGYIDLLIEFDDYYLIVDYKTDSISKSNSVESKVEKYTKQLNVYSQLLRINLPEKPIKSMFLFLDSNDQIEFEIGNFQDSETSIPISE